MVVCFLRSSWFVLILCSVVACQNTPPPRVETQRQPSVTVVVPTLFSTPSVTPSHTPVVSGIISTDTTITPPERRRWEAATVLIQLYTSPGYTDEEWAWATSPDLVVYRDGTVIVERGTWISNTYKRDLLEAHLATPELCGLLARIESDGFFDFEPAQYQAVGVTDSGVTSLSVRGWRSNAVSGYALDFTIDSVLNPDSYSSDGGKIPEGLIRTYSWLPLYIPPNAAPYIPDRVQMWAYPVEHLPGTAAPQWRIHDLSLDALMANAATQDDPYARGTKIEVEGATAEALWAELGTYRVGYFKEGDAVYAITIRPLLPFESQAMDSAWGSSPRFTLSPTAPLDCTMDPLPDIEGADGNIFDRSMYTPQPTPTSSLPPLTNNEVESITAFVGERTHQDFSVSPLGDFWVVTGDLDANLRSLRLEHIGASLELLERMNWNDSDCTQVRLAAHSDQSVFVGNPCRATITHLSPTGDVLTEWGSVGIVKETDFDFIRDIMLATDEQSLYVVDSGNRRITQWTLEGQLIGIWDAAELGVQKPIGIATDSQHRFYLIDEDTNQVVVYEGGVQATWALPHKDASLNSIAYDETLELVYVGDNSMNYYIYAPNGVYRLQGSVNDHFPVQVETGVPGRLYVSAGFGTLHIYESHE